MLSKLVLFPHSGDFALVLGMHLYSLSNIQDIK